MVQFNELGLSKDGKKIIIDAQVIESDFYQDVYLDTINIDTYSNYTEAGVSTTPIYTHTVTGEQKKVHLVLDNLDLNNTSIQGNLFFVYVKVKGTPSPETPCGMDEVTTTGTIVDTHSIYNISMGYLRQVEDSCEIPKDFIDMMLKYKAFNLALETQNFPTAIKYWEKFFKGKKATRTVNKCCG